MPTRFSNEMSSPPAMDDRRESTCKVCGDRARLIFKLPSSKLTGQPIPDLPDDCSYFRCVRCGFLFSHLLDSIDNSRVYDASYWDNQDPDWGGRVNQTLRLLMLANVLLCRLPWELDVCDFGSGMGTFVAAGREHLGLKTWGCDIIEPRFGREYFVRELPERRFDVITACEVLEHLPDPVGMLDPVIRALKPGGVFAFQTAEYHPDLCQRDWWYLGPANGHVSHYDRKTFDHLYEHFGGTDRLLFDGYPGVQAWRVGGARRSSRDDTA